MFHAENAESFQITIKLNVIAYFYYLRHSNKLKSLRSPRLRVKSTKIYARK